MTPPTRMRIVRSALTAIAPIVAGMVAGCGYTTQPPFPADIQTVHVEMFQSKEFRRELEMRLTEALVKRINQDTPFRCVERAKADSVLTGEIIEVRQRTLGTDFQTDLPRETGGTIVVSYRWKDLRNGRILVDRPRFTYTTTYIPPVGETFYKGMTRGLERLAEQIVESMETAF